MTTARSTEFISTASTQNPDQLLDALCRAHPKSAATLRLVHAVCTEHHRNGKRDFSLTTIGSLCSVRRGPTAAYLRTKPAHRYVALIRAFAKDSGVRVRKHMPANSEIDAVLEGLSDPTIRARVGIMFSELTALRRESRGCAAMDREFARTRISLPHEEPKQDAEGGLTPLERLALQQAIEPGRLNEWGWRIDDGGRVVTRDSGAVVFAAGFASAVEKTVRHWH